MPPPRRSGDSDPGRAGVPEPGRAGSREPRRAADFDPGLARERTRLAWTRTAIAFAAVGAAVLKSHLVAGLTILALAGIVWGLRQLFRDTAVTRSQSARLLGVTLTVVAVALVALVLSFFGHPR
jgi:uncharacterized membrane protein YidH (DUF202 family)